MGGNGTSSDDGTAPDVDSVISAWAGEKADDAHLDVVGTDADFYHEANSFTSTVTVTYNGSSASVETSNSKILHHVTGAYVTLDMQTNSVSNVEMVLLPVRAVVSAVSALVELRNAPVSTAAVPYTLYCA